MNVQSPGESNTNWHPSFFNFTQSGTENTTAKLKSQIVAMYSARHAKCSTAKKSRAGRFGGKLISPLQRQPHMCEMLAADASTR